MREWKADPRFLQWNSIKPLANSDISRFIAVVPIVGYLILFNDGFAKAISFDFLTGYDGTEPSPFWLTTVTKLRFAFFGSLFVLTSSVLFRLRGPSILIGSMSDLEYCERVVSSYSAAELKEIEKQVTSEMWTFRTPLLFEETEAGLRSNNGNATPKLSGFREKRFMVRKYPDYVRLLAREFWAGEMHKNPISRYATLLSASLGYLMLSISTLDIFQAVMRDLLP